MDTKTKIKKFESCPLCGSRDDVQATEYYRGFPPEVNPYEDKLWYFQARFKAYCGNCFCTQDVEKKFLTPNQGIGEVAVKEFFLERENLWNRRNKNESD